MNRNYPFRCPATRSGQGGGSYRECGLPPIWFAAVVIGLFGLGSMLLNCIPAILGETS